jgi:hypothetical protein
MKKLLTRWCLLVTLILPNLSWGQTVNETIDTSIVAAIRKEGFDHSQVMDILGMLTDVHGPRLSFSPGFQAAANYAKDKMEGWGLTNAHFDGWGDLGRGWYIRKFNLSQITPTYTPLNGYPKAWSPGVKGDVAADLVLVDVKTLADLEKYEGKLKGKIVMMDLPPPIKLGWVGDARRLTDSTLLKFANDEYRGPSGRYRPPLPDELTFRKWDFFLTEGVLAVISPTTGRGDNGAMLVSGVYLPFSPDVPREQRANIVSPKAPNTLPQVALQSEHYNRLYRMVVRGIPVKLSMALQVSFTPPSEGFNVIAEIPGTDLKAEVVMIGAHLDSWHSGTGATDNGAGSSVCLEAMRILTTLGVPPRRTIRIGLWGGEEQGLLGSRGYVKKHLGKMVDGQVSYAPEAEKFSAYFSFGEFICNTMKALVPFLKNGLSPFMM